MPVITTNTNRSTTYVGTFDVKDADDMQIVTNVRSQVKALNRLLREDGYTHQYYVKLQGRGHRQGNRRYNQSLPLRFAERVDAYVYKR